MKHVLFICDRPEWSFYHIANLLNEHVGDDIEVRPEYTTDKSLPNKLKAKNTIGMFNPAQGHKYLKPGQLGIIRNCGHRTFRTKYDEIGTEDFHRFDHIFKDRVAISPNKFLNKVAYNARASNTFLTPNGVELNLFKPLPKTNAVFTAGLAVDFNTTWNIAYKGAHLAIAACEELDIPLHLTSYDYAKMKAEIPHEKMPNDFFAKINCMLLPTMGEGCSNITSEALACGVPVITTKVAYHGEELTHGKNALFVERTVRDIKYQIKALINDPERAYTIGMQARRFAEEFQDIKETSKVYRKAILKAFNDK